VPLHYAPDRIEVGFSEGSYYLTCLQDAETLQSLRELAAEFNHQPTFVTITPLAPADEVNHQSLVEKKKLDHEQHVKAIRQEVAEHPVVQEALKVLGGEIVEIKAL